MRRFPSWIIAGLVVLSTLACGEKIEVFGKPLGNATTPSVTLTEQVVEVGCALCMLGVPDRPGCETAIRVDGAVFIASGSHIPDARDHETGMCDRIQQARVSGTTADASFVATDFVLLP